MRQVLVHVRRGEGASVLAAARRLRAVNVSSWSAEGENGPQDIVLLHVGNADVEALLDALDGTEGLHVSYLPESALALHPPEEEAPDQVIDPKPRSGLEVFLAGLQSVGSWKGFLGYAAAAGVIVWSGLFTNTIYLLVAAMLIAPFAGPAMTVALATARGDAKLLGKSLGRYFAAILVCAAVGALLTKLARQEIPTNLMTQVTTISAGAALLPLTAGAAGALNLVQSRNNSLVSGAAVGMLVAAALAPPAGILGMAAMLRDWGMVKSALFLLALQLVGINLSGTIVFRLYGVKPEGTRYPRGRSAVTWATLAFFAVALVTLLAWQLHEEPALERSTLSQRATAEVRDVVDSSGLALLLEAEAHFTRADIPGQNSLLVSAHVQPVADNTLSDDDLRRRLTDLIQERLLAADYGATPFVEVAILHPPRA